MDIIKDPVTQNIIIIVVWVLIQFGLIGPTAEKKREELNRKIMEIETLVKNTETKIESHCNGHEEKIKTMLEPINVTLNFIKDTITEIKNKLER